MAEKEGVPAGPGPRSFFRPAALAHRNIQFQGAVYAWLPRRNLAVIAVLALALSTILIVGLLRPIEIEIATQGLDASQGAPPAHLEGALLRKLRAPRGAEIVSVRRLCDARVKSGVTAGPPSAPHGLAAGDGERNCVLQARLRFPHMMDLLTQ